MRKPTTLLALALLAAAVAACDLLPLLHDSVEKPGASSDAGSPTTPESEVSVPPIDAKPSTQNLPSPTLEIPPPIN